MEKLICPACGAPLTPDSAQPFLNCEYCDTSVENKYYVAPPASAAQPAVQQFDPEPAAEEDADEAFIPASGSSLLQTLLNAGTALVASSMRTKRTTAHRTAVHHPPVGRAPLKSVQQRGSRPAAPHRPPEPPHAGGIGARPTRAVRPGSSRPTAHHGGMPGRGLGGPGGRGGRGGMGGPGGRHR